MVFLPAIVLATSLLLHHCFASPALSDLSLELIDEGLISLGDDGVPATECMVMLKNGATFPQTCVMASGFGPHSIGCFAVWSSSGLLQQGCYSGQELSLRDQCRKSECLADDKRGPSAVTFCCCHGPLCNKMSFERQ